jgi:hypothetical protein
MFLRTFVQSSGRLRFTALLGRARGLGLNLSNLFWVLTPDHLEEHAETYTLK